MLDIDQHWPISIAMFKYPLWQDFLTLGAIFSLWLVFLHLYSKSKIWALILLAGILIYATNLLNGFETGIRYPIIGEGKHDTTYWQDSLNIQSGLEFLQDFELLQPHLRVHSQTHPPGALLLFFYLRAISDNPYFVSITILGISLMSAWFIYKIALDLYPPSIAKLLATIFLILPPVHIYFWSTLDAVICSLFIGAFWAWRRRQSFTFFSLTLSFVFLGSSLTYAILWLLGVLIYEEWRATKRVSYSFTLITTLVIIYMFIDKVGDFNYFRTLLTASELEASHGGRPGYSFGSYIVTRIEDVLEIIIFFGPYLTLVAYRNFRQWLKTFDIFHPITSYFVAILGLLSMFVTGAYYTGETARAALYIYPFLIIPLGHLFTQRKVPTAFHFLILNLVFLQTVLMQTFGWFAW